MSGEAAALIEGAMEWLRQNYVSHRFFLERDVVWTVQLHIVEEIETQSLPFRVYTNYRIYKEGRGGWLPDLAILRISGQSELVEVTADFKYEPSHTRPSHDIPQRKLPLVYWTGAGSVAKDVERAKEIVDRRLDKVAYGVFIDEGGAFRHRPPFQGSEWRDWGEVDPMRRVPLLWACFRRSSQA